MKNLRVPLYGVALLVALGGFHNASATVTGSGSSANCGGGGVHVTATTITWLPPGSVAGTGCIQFGIGTSITYTAAPGGVIGPGAFADIQNLPGPAPFIHPLGTPVNFLLSGLNVPTSPTNGVGQAACNGLSLGQSCIVTATSPFLLTLVDTDAGAGVTLGTSIGMVASGTVTDGVGIINSWTGGFTTQSNKTPGQIAAAILGTPGFVEETHSETLIITTSVPEPGTVSMLVFGAALCGLGYRRRKA